MSGLIKKWFPVIIFLTVLFFTNILGLILLLFGPDEYWKMSYTFSGQTLPDVSMNDFSRIIMINVISILMLLLGFFIGNLITKRIKKNYMEIRMNQKHFFVIDLIFLLLSGYIIFKMFSILDIRSIVDWLDYNSFIHSRVLMMNSLSFNDFVIIYSILPLLFCLSIPNMLGKKRYLFVGLKSIFLVFINLYIFQKRPLICTILLICFFIMSYYIMAKLHTKLFQVAKISALILLALYIIYLSGVYANTLGDSSGIYIKATEKVNMLPISSIETNTNHESSVFKTFALEGQSMKVSAFVSNNLMSLAGLFNRTAYASIAYTVIFPKYHTYYPIDLGLDIVGMGTMPDDNQYVWKILNPSATESGSTDAPFFIILYSQGGILVSSVGSFIVGLCFGFFWNILLKKEKINVFQAGFSTLICLLSAYLSIGGGRNSLLSAYGLIWPLLIMIIIYMICNFFLGGKIKKIITPRICMLVTSGVVNDSRVLREAKIASENGFDVTIIGRQIMGLTEPDKSWSFKINLINIQRASNGGVIQKIIERVKIGLALTIHAIKNKPQIIHSNDFDTLPFAYYASFITGSGLVYDSHELWSENELISTKRNLKSLVKMIERFYVNRCDHVVTVSNASGEWLKKLYNIKNLSIVTNCPYRDKRRSIQKYEKFELLCHGQYNMNRGYEELIQSAEYVKNDDIGICFRGFGDKMNYYIQMAEDTKQNNIRICEKVPPFDVVYAASESHVGVIITKPVSISYNLTVSNKLFECIHAGLPVILSDVPEHRYLIEKYNFGLILDDNTVNDLVEAARKLKYDSVLYQQLCQNAEKASEELCWENEGLKLVNIYKNIII